jgi:hypothetical protein
VVVAGDQRPAFVRELAEERLRGGTTVSAARMWPGSFSMLGVEAPPGLCLTLGEALLKDGDRRGAEAAFAKTSIGLERRLERVEDREALRRRRSPGRTPNECVVANCSALPTTSTRGSPWRRRSKNSGASTKRPRST